MTRNTLTTLAINLVALLLMLWVGHALYSDYQKQKQRILESNVAKFESRVSSTLSVYKKFSQYVFEDIKTDSDIFRLMRDAYHTSDDEKRDVYRSEIYHLVKNKYNLLTKHNFRQVHFHFANGDSFLRVHKPEKYGDNLFSIRETVKVANQEKRTVQGFEEGRIFNGYRFVYPVNVNGEHIGSVEVSLSMSSIVTSLFSLYPEDDFYFIIDQNIVEKKVFPDMRRHYFASDVVNGYFFDKIIFDKHKRDYKYSVLTNDDPDWRALINQKVHGKEKFSVVKKSDGKFYIASFLNVDNIKGENVAYLVSISESKGIAVITKNLYISLLMVILIALSFVMATWWGYLNRIKLRNLSNTDFLTKLHNRQGFSYLIKHTFSQSKKNHTPFSIVIFDVDFFKKVNDKYGHNVGDMCLAELAKLVSGQIRSSDCCARWGGEEFVILLPNATEEQALQKAKNLVKKIENHRFQSVDKLTISAGVAQYPLQYHDPKSQDPNGVINYADRALYHSKAQGRNQATAWSQIQSTLANSNAIDGDQ